MLPRGVEEYLERRAAALHLQPAPRRRPPPRRRPGPARPPAGSAEEREARKALTRIDRQLARVTAAEAELNAAILEAGQDYERLTVLGAELAVVSAERGDLELEWLEAAESLE